MEKKQKISLWVNEDMDIYTFLKKDGNGCIYIRQGAKEGGGGGDFGPDM